jgi:hypothetical protein
MAGARACRRVARGGRPDLAGSALVKVHASTLLIVRELIIPSSK